jgi:hypothetical protein
MNSVNPVEVENHSSPMGRIVSDWYALNPDIARLWVYEADEPDHDDARDIYVTVALTPVCDSDDISPIWLARCTDWQRDLQRLIGRRVHLDWFDGDTEVVPCAEDSEHARACLASIVWRDSSSDLADGLAHLLAGKGARVVLEATRKDGFATVAEDSTPSTGPT